MERYFLNYIGERERERAVWNYISIRTQEKYVGRRVKVFYLST